MWEIVPLIVLYILLTYLKNVRRLIRNQYEHTETEQINAPRLTQYEDKIESNKLEKEKINSPVKSTSDCIVRKKRGKVPTSEYKVLQNHRVEMIQLEPSKIKDHLYRNGVIDKDDVEKIEQKCQDLKRKGAETMYNIIYNSGKWAFQKLLEALNQAGYKDMAKKLKDDLEKKIKDPNSASDTSKERGPMSAIEFEVLRDNHERLVNELDSSVLKNHLFENGLINEDELEEITKEEEKLRKKGAEEMMTIIYESGANAFPKLVKSLEEAGYEDLSLKLNSDLIQKKEEDNLNCQKMDLSLVTFPEYPHPPCLKYDAIQGDNVSAKFEKECFNCLHAKQQWFDSMCEWFNDVDFLSKEVLKLVVKDWLVKMEEVAERGCLKINEINFYFDMAEKVKNEDDFKTFLSLIYCHQYPIYRNVQSRDDVIHGLKKYREMYHEYHRDAINQIKHNLEVIIGEKNGDIQPIDTSKCYLAGLLYPVINDVRDIWEKLP